MWAPTLFSFVTLIYTSFKLIYTIYFTHAKWMGQQHPSHSSKTGLYDKPDKKKTLLRKKDFPFLQKDFPFLSIPAFVCSLFCNVFLSGLCLYSYTFFKCENYVEVHIICLGTICQLWAHEKGVYIRAVQCHLHISSLWLRTVCRSLSCAGGWWGWGRRAEPERTGSSSPSREGPNTRAGSEWTSASSTSSPAIGIEGKEVKGKSTVWLYCTI